LKFFIRLLTIFLAGLGFGVACAWPFQSDLKSDEVVQFQPSYAIEKSDGSVDLRVHAWVFEREPRRGAIGVFARYLGLNLKAIDPPTRARFERTARLFFVDTQNNKRLAIEIPEGSKAMGVSDSFGVSQAIIRTGQTSVTDSWINFFTQGPSTRFEGRAQRIPKAGISIISDIDDTIRDTNVLDHDAMIHNTFVHVWRALPTMAERYHTFTNAHADARVHYLSNAPFALNPLIVEFLQQHGFPEGSLHLRAVSAKSSMLAKITGETSTHKTVVIEQLFNDFPTRSFILIGDTGERDPEIYADIWRRFPSRVLDIYLHDVHPKPQIKRLNNLFDAGAPLHVFKRGQMPAIESQK
jgi:phosphatidate phosphatase APP1